jgi:hypothetical protein
VVDGPERDPEADRERERDDESEEPEPAAAAVEAEGKPSIVLDPLLCERGVVVRCFRLLLLLPLVVVVVAELDRRLLLSPPSSASRALLLVSVLEEDSSCILDDGRVSPCWDGTGWVLVPIGTRRSDDDDDDDEAAGGRGGPFRWFFVFEERRKRFFFVLSAVGCPSSCETVPIAAGAARGSTIGVDEAAVPTEEEAEDENDGRRPLRSWLSSSSSS